MTPLDAERTDTAADRTLALLSKSIVPVGEAGERVVRRQRLVPHLDTFTGAVFRERRRQRAFRLSLALAALAALAVVGIVGVLRVTRSDRGQAPSASILAKVGAVRVAHQGLPLGAPDRVPFELGARDRVETREGRAEVSLVSGAVVELEPMSALGLGSVDRADSALAEQIELAAGKIRVRVPKLGSGSRLSIGTPNATVTVHGTVFVVEVLPEGPEGPAVTRVSVTEGRVSVASSGREIFLGPGANWSSAPRNEQPAARASSGPVPPTAEIAHEGAVRPAAHTSSLPAENELFRSALAARRGGNPGRAIGLLDRLLAGYKTSPLATEARAERSRAVLDLERAEKPSSAP
jgi:hypothetical protein